MKKKKIIVKKTVGNGLMEKMGKVNIIQKSGERSMRHDVNRKLKLRSKRNYKNKTNGNLNGNITSNSNKYADKKTKYADKKTKYADKKISGNDVKNLVSILLPIVTIFIIALSYDSIITGYAVYEGENSGDSGDKVFYRIDGSVSISLEEKIPLDAYIQIRISDYKVKINLIDFLDLSREHYEVDGMYIVGKGTYTVDFESLGIFEGFEEGNHTIKTEIVRGWSVLYRDEGIIEVSG